MINVYALRRLQGDRFERLNAIIDGLASHISSYVNLIGSATLPLPAVCHMNELPGTACRVEGHPGARFFPGTDPIDEAERIIGAGVRHLFDLDDGYAVSGQPHSATQANQVVFHALLDDAESAVCAMSPVDGGHISHRLGLPSGATFVPFPFRAGLVDYAALAELAQERRPALIVAGATSYARAIDYERLKQIADEVGAHLHADLAHTAPFVASGMHPPAFPFCDSATLDPSKNLRGPRGGVVIYRTSRAAAIERAIFPRLQTSPNQNGLMAKAACFLHWSQEDIRPYAEAMVAHARWLDQCLQPLLGTAINGGTDTHLLSFDVTPLGLTGLGAENMLMAARVFANRNQVPGDPNGPRDPSGIRFGTTLLAILEYSEADTRLLGESIAQILAGEDSGREAIAHLVDTYHRPLVSIANESP